MHFEEAYQIIRDHIAAQELDEARKVLGEFQPADIAEFVENLPVHEIGPILNLLSPETAGEVINQLDAELAGDVLSDMGEEKTGAIIDEMYSDDVADILGEMTDPEKDKILSLMEQEDAIEVRELLEFKEDTAGGIMTTEYVAILQNITAERAIQVIRETAPDAETVYYVYVINDKNQLVGVISLRELIIANPKTLIEDIMHHKVKSVNVHMDQEEVAAMVAKYDFLAIPVVDDDQSLMGIITVDDVIDVIHEEASEDIYRLAGTAEVDFEDALWKRIWMAVRNRLPWLLVTLLGGFLAGGIIRGLEKEIQTVVALSYFIPLLTGMGGNVGTQSSTLAVRGLATGQIDAGKMLKTVGTAALIGIGVGLICGLIVTVMAFLWQKSLLLGLVVGISLCVNMITASTMGTFVPLVLKRFGVDPAVASAPFISTTIDITGLLIYAGLSSVFIKWLV
ncbi:magnesium transporter [Dehalobacterium formicoaceticum]|uniref:magnesium transporter n=1 Tax=Dehalobacterium formicoaceticum TaxID=51515 RepID=UPI000B7F3C74|nr:magnesium transporter [Dehalobacterium formicoaceticum]